MKRRVYWLLVMVSVYSYNSNSQSVITKQLTYGNYKVGYKVFHNYDFSRSFFLKYDYYGKRTTNSMGRPMQISVWYPAKNTNPQKRNYLKDYIGFTASEIDFSKDNPKDQLHAVDNFIQKADSLKQELIINLLNEKIYSIFNAEEFGKGYPIILYAPPLNTSAIDNFIICEYLSSKGYLVLSAMSKGEYTALQGESIRDIHTQAEDLAYLLDFAKRKYPSDNVGVFGMSRGGLANIIFASKNRGIDAVVSLDGSIMSQGWLNDIEKSEFYNPETFTSNLLLIGKNLETPDQNPSTFYDKVKYADKALIRYDHEHHSYFSGLDLLYEMTLVDTLSLRDKEKNYSFFVEVTRYVADFFDQYLKGSDSFKEYDQKLYKHSFSFVKGIKKPLDPKTIGQVITKNGFDYADGIIKSTLMYEKDYLSQLDWRELLQASVTLQNDGRVEEAIKTLLLSDQAFPGWFITNFHLAKLYVKNGNMELAKKYFQKAIKDNPRHYESIKALNQMNFPVRDYHDFRIKDLKPYLGRYNVDENRFREIYIENEKVFLSTNYWSEPVELWPFSSHLFLVESDNPKHNMQILFQFDEKGKVKSLCIRGLNSGRINTVDVKE